jgi:ADP-ribose pyrophosphatase YjhB (NUDIX family)
MPIGCGRPVSQAPDRPMELPLRKPTGSGTSVTVAEQIALWVDRLRVISGTGLMHTENVHDQEAFRAVQAVALEMAALVTSGSLAFVEEPLRLPLYSRPAPLVGGDAAVIDADGRMLLIRRADNALWAMPGGFFAVGETPAEGVVREALEETGVHCRVRTLVGVFDSRLWGTIGRHQILHFVFLCEPLDRGAMARPTHVFETLGAAWFAENELPDALDPGHRSRIPEAFRVWRGEGKAVFDRPSDTGT